MTEEDREGGGGSDEMGYQVLSFFSVYQSVSISDLHTLSITPQIHSKASLAYNPLCNIQLMPTLGLLAW